MTIFYKQTPFYRSKEDVSQWLSKYGIPDCELIKDDHYGYVVNSNSKLGCNLVNKNIEKILVKFNYVEGHFLIAGNNLKSLQGCPTEVRGDFNCSRNNLSSLKHGPSIVGGSYYCSYNRLQSLEHIANKIKNLKASYNELKDLEHISQLLNGYLHVDNNFLENVKGIPPSVEAPKLSTGQKSLISSLNLQNNPLLKELQDITSIVELEKIILEKSLLSANKDSRLLKL